MAIATDSARTALNLGFHQVLVADLRPHPSNIRKNLGDLTELAGSIASKGVLEPLLVTVDGFVVCGHRRLAAAIQVGEQRVPSVVREMAPQEVIEAMLVENLQRSDLTPLEEANAYQELLNLGESAEEISAAVSINADRIRRRAALLQLPNAARDLLESHRITIGAAEELLQLKSHPEEIERLIKGTFFDDDVEKTPLASFGWQIADSKLRVKEIDDREAAKAKIEKEGLKVVDMPDRYTKAKTAPRILGTGFGEINTPAGAHKKLDCHAVAISSHGKLVGVCTKPKNHPEAAGATATTTSAARDYAAERAETDRLIEARVAVLRTYIANHASGSAEVDTLAVMNRVSYNDELVCDLLGIEVTKPGNARHAFDARDGFVRWLVEGATVVSGSIPIPTTERLKMARMAIAFAEIEADGCANTSAWQLFLRGLGYEQTPEEIEECNVDTILGWAKNPHDAFIG